LIAQGSGGQSIFGTLQVAAAPADDFSSADLTRWLGTSSDPNPSVVVASGSNLSVQWAAITQTAQDINNANLQYSPLTQNSNGAASTELTAANIPLPAGTSISGPYWAPDSDEIFATPMTTASNRETVTNTGGNLTVTDDGENGVPIDQFLLSQPGSSPNSLTVTGSNDTLFGYSNDQYTVTGTNDSVNDSSSEINLGASEINLAVNGSSDTISTSDSGDTINLSGIGTSSDTVDESAGTVDLANNIAAMFLNGSSDTVSAGTSDQVNVTGSGNNITAGTSRVKTQ